jgi:hypothetical protein
MEFKLKRETMNKNYLEGGLKMIDIDKYIEAIHIKWVKKLTNKNFANGVHLSHSRQVAHVYYQLFDSKMADGDQL